MVRIDHNGILGLRVLRNRIRRKGILLDQHPKTFNSSRANPTQNQTPQSADLFAAARPATDYSKTDKFASNGAANRLVRSHFRDLSARQALSHSLLAPIAPRDVDYRDQLKRRKGKDAKGQTKQKDAKEQTQRARPSEKTQRARPSHF